MSVSDFIRQYYIDPIVFGEGYNFVNTLTYAILVVIVTWLTFKFLEKMKVKIDRNFATSILILAVFGTMVRLLEEAGISSSFLLVTPMIWIETFAFIFALFLVSKFIEKKFKIPYHKTLSATGLFLMVIPLTLVLSRLNQFTGMLISLALLVPFAIGFYLIKWRIENKLVSMAHIFDATATFTAVQFFGFTELHVVPRLLIGTFNPVVFIVVKILVVVGSLVLIDKYSDDKRFNNFLKLIIAIIGLAPAIRDFFLLGLS
ncbi:MAG: DUF63 family protein [Candidatus Aenigmatarchaeota archaeon]|nr:DUF63 family protein [Candidatus Aenigmarchaeota archaeon]